jgi:hypothetical protein
MKAARVLCTFVLLSVSLLAPADARAETGQDKADAQGLFDLGKRLMVEGKFQEACPKLAESLRLDPVIGTMLFLGDCYENVGRTASAWAEFREAQGLAAKQSDAREKVARDRANALEPGLSKLVIIVTSPAAPDLRVKRDGFDVSESLWGAAIPVDPGPHAIIVTAPKMKEWTATVYVGGAASSSSVTVPPLEDALIDPDSAVAAAARGPAFVTPPARQNDGRAQRILGAGIAALGVVGLGIGTVFGLQAKSNLDASNSGHCVKLTNYCDSEGLSTRDTALTDARVSTITFGLGLAAVVGGAVVYLTAPRAEPKTFAILPSAGPRGGGLALHASF